MVALAGAVAGRRHLAEDIAQESFAKAHRRWDRIQRYERPGAWIRRVTINGALSQKRRVASETRTNLALAGDRSLEPAAPAPGMATGPDSAVWQAVAQLPGKQRASIALFYLEGHTVAEIGEILECSASTAKVHLHRGRTKLAELLSPQPSPPSSSASPKLPSTETNGGQS